ncbi:LytR/AlgR family response regulator transcription factor [Paraglaciecola hydrolytica]|uniref:Two-component system response regulator n=1 Tax=Paraglaciecola hydrolytica TaxID=1799789 RepID=A0A135ZZA5_9ALTE|nr:response regulator transcription factor [Paraglaciecola hydrolytica]KXI28294.1 two-component system response regulator [Paraglaciecola hydrolytica]
MLTTLIVDDEPLAHEVLKHHLQAMTDITVVAQCYNASQALSYLASHRVDLLLLDINMPALSGIELLKVLGNRPQVILISAYQQYALEGFELDVVDYLLKPVSAQRFSQALDRVRRRLHEPPKPQTSHIVLKVDREKRKFLLEDISLLEAYGNYVKVWQAEQVALATTTLKQLMQQLPAQEFVQVHKSFIVNRQHISATNHEHIRLKNGRQIKIGKSFKQSLLDLI